MESAIAVAAPESAPSHDEPPPASPSPAELKGYALGVGGGRNAGKGLFTIQGVVVL
jgi:hypothetical protein